GRQPTDVVGAKVDHLLADGRMVSLPPFPVDTTVVRIPPAFPGAMTVQLVSDADWSELDRVTVAVQKSETAPTGTFAFDKPNATTAISLDMPDPADRSFRYRMTRRLKSGVEEEDPWITTDAPLVVAGRVAANTLVVDVTPVGPELAEAGILLIQVELLYVDVENLVREEKTVVISARGDRFRWEVPVKNPLRKQYDYRVTV